MLTEPIASWYNKKKLPYEIQISLLHKENKLDIVQFGWRAPSSFPPLFSSKINTVSDGIKVLRTIVKMFKDHKPLRFFTIIFAILFVLGLIVGLPVVFEFYKTGYITKVPSAVLATGIMILAVICEQCGIILQTIVKQHKENYELNLLRYDQMEKLKK